MTPTLSRGGYGARVQQAMQALGAMRFLSHASDRDLDVLASASSFRRLAKGQVLFTEGDASDHVYVVASGRLKIQSTSTRGEDLVYAVVGPGELFGELSVLDGSARSASAVALDEVDLWCVPGPALLSVVRASPAVALALAQELAGQLRRLTATTADLVFLDLPRRLAKFLATNGRGGGISEQAQSDVAAQLGVTRQSLNRALQRLQDRGWVEVQRTAITVLDLPALERFADS